MARDVQYEKLNTIYDMMREEYGIKCKNYELCEQIVPLDHHKYHGNYFCMDCGDWFKIGGFGWNELEFRVKKEECIVCNEICTTQLKFPTNCGHWFCVSCSRNILFWDETRYHLSPEPYGCPPCPNGCVNPVRGRQCYCEEYDDIKDKWEKEQPIKFNEWNDAENESIELSETDCGSVFGSRKCPLCRKKYERLF